ncbi:MAG: NYN domain-containing protein [Bifidobacteriaceae bacterium]|jgi:uncharacterized LabA/DUF88 family protein|nr:NYN domain-containing protein [Bifidobacteriaceae bacterium]
MRSQCGLYVDAGYLLAGVATRLTGTSLRSGIKVDFEELIAKLTARAEEIARLPLLRVNWYDASHNALPGAEHQRIGSLPKVKVRLGRIGFQGEQKGVDLRIGLDMVAHARYGAVDMILLVSGDDDLTEAVEEAQMHGVQVVVLAIPDNNGHPHGVSPHLQRAADGIELATADDLTSVQAAVMIPPPSSVSMPRSSVQVTPKPAPPSTHLTSIVGPGRLEAPYIAYRTETGVKSHTQGENLFSSQEVSNAIDNVVSGVVKSLLSSTSEEQRADMIKAKPSVPREVDRALLLDLAERLNDYDLSDRTRFQLRQRFWDEFATAQVD